MSAKPRCIETYQRRPGIFQATETTTTSVETIRDEVWVKKTIHRKYLKQIAHEIGQSYRDAEDLFEEAAFAYGDKMFKHGVRLGRTMPRTVPLRGVAA